MCPPTRRYISYNINESCVYVQTKLYIYIFDCAYTHVNANINKLVSNFVITQLYRVYSVSGGRKCKRGIPTLYKIFLYINIDEEEYD